MPIEPAAPQVPQPPLFPALALFRRRPPECVDSNIRFEERWAEDNPELLPICAAELARVTLDAIFVSNSYTLRALRQVRCNIPIVFAAVADPVGQGFVESLARPGGNITGFASREFDHTTIVLELLKKLDPTMDHITFMYDPAQPAAAGVWTEIEVAAPLLGLRASRVPVRTAGEIEQAFAELAKVPKGGVYLQGSPTTDRHGQLIALLALQHRIPALHDLRYFVESGGLASYAPDDKDLCRRAASYVDRIFKREKPSDLPVQLPTKFQMTINLKTERVLGLHISPDLLALADESSNELMPGSGQKRRTCSTVDCLLSPCVDGSWLASAFFTRAGVVGAAMCSAY
jgi:putative tryptophan/tyrosine transport system substrate-binding protein